MRAVLMLEDGKIFPGEALGAPQERIGEVILNTAVVGYQEMMTDPANAGKILVLTYPLIGNYGTAPKFNESNKAWIAGLVIKERSRIYSNWQAKQSFDDFVREHGVTVLSGIDTRTLTVHLRQKGQMPGIVSTRTFEPKELSAKIEAFRKNRLTSVLGEISVKQPRRTKAGGRTIAVLDLGVTRSIMRQLEALGFSPVLFPYNAQAQEVLRVKPAGLIISGGPEDDPGLSDAVSAVKPLLGRLPVLGVSTGHQVLARALGARVTKMKLGHHGVNYPILSPASYRGDITVQNHSFAVEADSVSKIKGLKVTAYNLNDRTVEEIESKRLKVIGIQYYPASPGFNEPHRVFQRFIKLLRKG